MQHATEVLLDYRAFFLRELISGGRGRVRHERPSSYRPDHAQRAPATVDGTETIPC
jgi:hypothetical protein